MGKNLVAYFSASGVTKRVAQRVAEAADAEIFEIAPKTPYTNADLNWNDKTSRSSIEMGDKSIRPEIDGKTVVMSLYDTIYIGFPIWWYVAPTIINTFLESYDMGGKRIILFATSGGSGMGNTTLELKPSAPNANFVAEKRLDSSATKEEIAAWIATIK